MALPPLRPRFATGTQVWFRSAPITKQFWSVWNTAKLTLLEKGFVTRKEGDTWILDQWLAGKLVDNRLVEGVYRLTAIGIERLERAKREQQKPLAPIKVEMEFLPLPERLESKLRGYQVQPARQLLRALRHGKQEWGYPGAVALCDMGCHAKGQLILMADGSRKKVEDIVVGDSVMGWKGPQTVTQLKRGRSQMAKIEPACGEPWVVNLDHILTVVSPVRGRHVVVDVSVRNYMEHEMRWLLMRSSEKSPFKFKGERFDIELLEGEQDYYGFSLDGDGRFLLGDYVVTHNTGKTYHTLAAALATGRKVAVFCPPVGKGGWKRAFTHFGADPHFLESYEAVRGAWRPEIATMDATGQFHWANAEQIIVILDECQALRHEDTLNFRCFSALLRQGIPCIAASATLALSPVEMKFAGRLVGLHQGGYDWDRFCATHGCERKTKSRPWVWNKDLKHLRRINEQLFPHRGCRIRKEELGDQCPETEIKVLPIHSSQAETIEAETIASEQTIAALERRQAPKGQIVAMRRNLRMAIWKKCETALVPHIARMVQRDVEEGWSVAIFVNFTETRETLGKMLGTSAGFFGGQSLKARQVFEKQFQNEEIHILISNLKAGGASVSLHDVNGVRSRRAYIFPSDDVIPMEQATGRVDRVGGMSKSEQFIPCLSGTRMVRTVENIRRKMMQISTLNDGADASGSKF